MMVNEIEEAIQNFKEQSRQMAVIKMQIDLFEAAQAELAKQLPELLKKFVADRDLLLANFEKYFDSEREQNLPTNMQYKKLYNDLKSTTKFI
jgi:hypothetical protein